MPENVTEFHPVESGDTNPAPTEGRRPKVEFSDAQQSRVNELLAKERRDATSKARAEAAEEYGLERSALADQIRGLEGRLKNTTPAPEASDSLKTELTEAKRLVETHKAELLKLRTEADQAREQAQSVRKHSALLSAAERARFLNPQHAAQLVESSIQWDADNNRFTVLNENGQPRFNREFEPMSVDELLSEFAAQHSYMVRGTVSQGLGTTPNSTPVAAGPKLEDVFGPKSSGRAAQDLFRQDPARYKALRQQAVQRGLIAG